jgi:phosphatidylinositol glycan class A protein
MPRNTKDRSEDAGQRRYRIAMVCDFFYPRLGGVEMHIWSLSQHLLRLGHKVIVVTHYYGNRKGVRYLPGPLKVYYCVRNVEYGRDNAERPIHELV